MDPATIAIIGSIVIPAILALVAYFQWRENHSDRSTAKKNAVIKAVVAAEIKPIADTAADHTIRLGQFGEHLLRIEDMFKEQSTANRKTADEMIEVRTRLGMIGSAVEQLAMNSAKKLHQPDPRRRTIDHLLEAFMEGTLSDTERIDLKKYLIKIRNYEPSQGDIGFPVLPGEETAAAILLSTMDLVDPVKMATLGHAMHRNDNTGEL